MTLFTERIDGPGDWSRVFQSVLTFAPLVEYIMKREGLPAGDIENLTPGTNAVFKSGDHVIKIFAPAGSGFYFPFDLHTELFAARRTGALGVDTPQVIADGFVDDSYRFAYIITEYIPGAELLQALKTMTDDEKTAVGRRLRNMTDRMNTPSAPFNDVDVTSGKGRYRRWEPYPERFKAERLAYIGARDWGKKVFVHGDLCPDNIIQAPDGRLYILDFADAVLAPICYEHALVAFAFGLDAPLLRGFFADYSPGDFLAMCFDGLLIHDFGGDIVREHIGEPKLFSGLDDLRSGLKRRIATS